MTYCLAIKVDEGMVFASDSRTNAGLDDYNSYSKMFTYSVGDRCVVLITSGNLHGCAVAKTILIPSKFILSKAP